MKKLLALTLALMLALTCTSALAQTIVTKVTVDGDQAKSLISGFGVPTEQLGLVDPILALVNALGVRVTTVADGAQVDLSLNGEDALSLGWATDEAGVNLVSTLFPNYCLTVKNETISQLMEQAAAYMPGASGEGGEGSFDVAAMQEVFGGYFQKWFEACSAAGQPGEPVSVEFEYGAYTFDTMVPVTVDMEAITKATKELMDELLADETAMAMIQGMAQGVSQSTGAEINPETFEADFKAGFEEWMAHFPNDVKAEIYTISDNSEVFYMNAESFYEGEENPFFTAFMLYEDAANMDMGFTMDVVDSETSETVPMEAGFAIKGSDMKMYFELSGVYMGLNMSFADSGATFDVFFMNAEQPLLTIAVEVAADGDRTLPVEAEGKTALAIEDIMADANSEAAQGLYGDIMSSGMSALGVVMEQVPELGSLLGMFTGDTEMAG